MAKASPATRESLYWEQLVGSIGKGDRQVAQQVLATARRDFRVFAGHESVLFAAQNLVDAVCHRRAKLYQYGRALARAVLWLGAHLRTQPKTTAAAVEPTLVALEVPEVIDLRMGVVPSQDGVKVDPAWLAFISALEGLPAYEEPTVSSETVAAGLLLEEQDDETEARLFREEQDDENAVLDWLRRRQDAEDAAANWRRAMGQHEVHVMHLEWTPIKHLA